MLFGSTQHNHISRFCEEIGDSYLDKTGNKKPQNTTSVSSTSSVQAKKFDPYALGRSRAGASSAGSSSTFAVGDKVVHKVFGVGMIISAQRMGNDTMLEVSFDKVGTKTLMANFCKMEKI